MNAYNKKNGYMNKNKRNSGYGKLTQFEGKFLWENGEMVK